MNTTPPAPADDPLTQLLTDRALASFRIANAALAPSSPSLDDWHRRGHLLPHRENVPFQAVTYRLFDSLPQSAIDRLKALLPADTPDAPAHDSRAAARLRAEIARLEDAGWGSCFLRNPQVAAVVAENLGHFDGKSYRLHAWCIMPNHVHVLIQPLSGHTLSDILHAWRSYTAKAANRLLGRTGRFWMEEYFDRWIRNETHLVTAISYILWNPVKAGLVQTPAEWRWLGPR